MSTPTKPFIFFTTSDIFSTFPECKNDTPVYIDEGADLLGGPTKFYSRGRLEAALAEGKRPVVLTSRRRLMDHDAWWLGLFPGDSGTKDVHVMGTRDMTGDSFTAYCKGVVESYGLVWPCENDDVKRGAPDGTPMFWTGALRVLNGKDGP